MNRLWRILGFECIYLMARMVKIQTENQVYLKMFKKIFGLTLLVPAMVSLFSLTAAAAQPQQLAKHGDWTAYVLKNGGSKVCYMVSKPIKAEGKYTRRGEVFALITHRPAESTKDVFSYITGYTYKSGSDAVVTIDGKKYVLFTQEDTAWAPDASSDSKLAKAIQAGSKMSVRGTSTRGTLTVDTYSLKGSGAAYASISKECKI